MRVPSVATSPPEAHLQEGCLGGQGRECSSLVTLEAIDGRLGGGAVHAHIGHLAHPTGQVCLQHIQGPEVVAGDGVALEAAWQTFACRPPDSQMPADRLMPASRLVITCIYAWGMLVMRMPDRTWRPSIPACDRPHSSLTGSTQRRSEDFFSAQRPCLPYRRPMPGSPGCLMRLRTMVHRPGVPAGHGIWQQHSRRGEDLR